MSRYFIAAISETPTENHVTALVGDLCRYVELEPRQQALEHCYLFYNKTPSLIRSPRRVAHEVIVWEDEKAWYRWCRDMEKAHPKGIPDYYRAVLHRALNVIRYSRRNGIVR